MMQEVGGRLVRGDERGCESKDYNGDKETNSDLASKRNKIKGECPRKIGIWDIIRGEIGIETMEDAWDKCQASENY